MNIKEIHSHRELLTKLPKSKNIYLLLHKKDSDQSECAKETLKQVELDSDDINVFSANVAEVRDIHENYGIKSVPSLIEFEDGRFKNVVKGCHDKEYYKAYFENIIFELHAKSGEKPSKNVTVYTTPTCPWCTTVKNFLRKNGVKYTEVDVASDQSAAQSMVSKSGQQGVPQTEINGEMVIGFDQAKLNRLLELKAN
ncbi:MAG: thioredoxin family protein [Cytophagales bacterium]|nr:thioredoxin family protein [Cytophagales bacterium]